MLLYNFFCALKLVKLDDIKLINLEKTIVYYMGQVTLDTS
jgi:hypothetical protein